MTRRHVKKTSNKRNNHQNIGLILMGFGFILVIGILILFLPAFNSTDKKIDDFSADDLPSAIPAPVDFQAPDVQATDIEGFSVSLKDYEGKVILVNNWAIWCPPCRAEMPILQAYYENHKDQNFTIIGIEAGQKAEDVQYHIDLYGLTFPVWLDFKQASIRAFQNGSLPNSYVIDGGGQVRYTWTGAINRKTLEQYITPLLEE